MNILRHVLPASAYTALGGYGGLLVYGISAALQAVTLLTVVAAPFAPAQLADSVAGRVPAVTIVSAQVSDTALPPTAPLDTSSIVVGLVADVDTAALLARVDGTVVGSRPVPGMTALTVDVPTVERAAALAALNADHAVRYAEPEGVAQGMAVVDTVDPLRERDENGLNRDRVPAAWSWTTGSADVTVAVVDSGVTSIEDLDDGRVLPGHDFVNDDDDPTDDQGHGTFVAGVIAGEANNAVGGVGVCWQCRILPVKVLKPNGKGGTTGTYADIAAGIVWAADHGADIINVSLGGRTDSQVLRDAVAHAVGAGALIVAAAGDGKSTEPFYPAAIEPVVAVGGTDNFGDPLPNSNTNPAGAPWIDLVAYGNRSGLDHLGQKVNYSGSSAAAPLVSGTAALAVALTPDVTAAAVRDALLTQSSVSRKSWGNVPALDAGRVAKSFGPPDSQAPVLHDIGLPVDGTPVCSCYRTVQPTITENRDIARLEVVIDGKVVASSAKWPPTISWRPVGLAGSTAVTVRARDSSGNIGEATGVVEFDTSLSASFVTPKEYDVVDGVTTVTIAGDPDLKKIDVVGGGSIDVSTGPGPWTTTVDFSDRPTGKWDLLVAYLTDRSGNEFALQQWVGVDHDTPVLTLDETQFPKILHGPVTFTPTVTDSSLVEVTLLVNGKVAATTGWNTNVLDWPAAATLTGKFTLTFQAVDQAGHRSQIDRTVTLDNTGPKVATVSPANKALLRGNINATASGVSDPAGTDQVDLYLNGGYVGSDGTAPFSIPLKTAGRNGTLKLTWQVYDKVGNKTTLVRTVTADNKTPKVTISKGPKNKAKVKGTVKVSASAKDTYGMSRVELLVNGKVVATDKTAPYTLKVNTARQKKVMKVRVRAYDKAGNVTYTATRTWYRR